MKLKALSLLFSGLMLTAAVAFAADKEVTLSGAGQCAKCSLGITKSCQNALVVKQDGKETVYLLAENDVSKKFNDELCSDTKALKVTGIVSEKDGQKIITASKIEPVKS